MLDEVVDIDEIELGVTVICAADSDDGEAVGDAIALFDTPTLPHSCTENSLTSTHIEP